MPFEAEPTPSECRTLSGGRSQALEGSCPDNSSVSLPLSAQSGTVTNLQGMFFSAIYFFSMSPFKMGSASRWVTAVGDCSEPCCEGCACGGLVTTAVHGTESLLLHDFFSWPGIAEQRLNHYKPRYSMVRFSGKNLRTCTRCRTAVQSKGNLPQWAKCAQLVVEH